VWYDACEMSGQYRGEEGSMIVSEAFEQVQFVVGPEVVLAFDLHGKMTPALAIEICHELKGMRPLFVEEPVPQENVAALRQVAERVIVFKANVVSYRAGRTVTASVAMRPSVQISATAPPSSGRSVS
jgi:L-alanine-DL-glutamate epimerase-like enolase superfamily enzyme